MDKRYQVFLSSTYADLKNERQKVLQTLMEMDCIPAGMELFPAVDEEQYEFIKRVIDDCDYYLLIIGGRYGSTTDEGISYTEKEYDYAVQKGLKIIALLHQSPENIPSGKTDRNPELEEKLRKFREKAQQNRLVKYWSSAGELPGLVALSLSKTIKTYPAVGWVRATNAGSNELLLRVNQLQTLNIELRERLQKQIQNMPTIEGLAGMDEYFEVTLSYLLPGQWLREQDKVSVTWGNLFTSIAPYLNEFSSEDGVRSRITAGVARCTGIQEAANFEIDEVAFQQIKIQFLAHKFIEVKPIMTNSGESELFWKLTSKGVDGMLAHLSVKTCQ